MKFKLSNYFDLFIIFILLFKIGFIGLAIYNAYLKEKIRKLSFEKNEAIKKIKTKQKNIQYWKDRCEFIYAAFMSCLIIWIFNPVKPRIDLLDENIIGLIFLFGLLNLITTDWTTFFEESKFV